MKRIINVGKKKGGSTSGTYSRWSGMLERYSKKTNIYKVRVGGQNTYTWYL